MYTDINIPSAAPKVISLGTRDGSQKLVPQIFEEHTFVPLFFFYASKGSKDRRYVKGNPAAIYGQDTFLETSKYFNHQTLGLNMCVGNGNLVGMQRIVPEDAEEAALLLSLVLEEKNIPVYQLDVNGKRVLDTATGLPIQTGTIAGHTYRWEVEDAEGKTYEQLLAQGMNGVVTAQSTPPSPPRSGDVVLPEETVVFDEVQYLNETANSIVIHGVLNADAIIASGLTDEGAIPATPSAGDALPADPSIKYFVDQHILVNESSDPITTPATVDLASMIDAGMTDKSFVPVALEGIVVPPLGSVIFDTNLYTNNSNVNATINELVLTAGDLTSAGLTDKGAWTPSEVTKYPWFVAATNGEGNGGNNIGVRLYPTSESNDYNVEKYNRLSFAAEIVQRPDLHANVVNVETVTGDKTVSFVHEPNAYDLYNRPLSLENLVESYDGSMSDMGYKDPEFRTIHIFQESIDQALQLIAAFEKEATLNMPWSDFQRGTALNIPGTELKYLANPITGMHTNRSSYISLVADASPTAIQLGTYNTVFANGGSDGTLDQYQFDMAVAREIQRYGDINDPVQDLARDLVTDFWDTGFCTDAKLKFNAFTSVRKDLNLAIALFENDETIRSGGPSTSNYIKGDAQSRTDEISQATMLLNNIRLVPESVKFNTPAMRTMLVAGSGKVKNSLFKDRVPLTFAYLDKFSKYCGGSRWVSEFAFDTAPGHIIDNMYDLSDSWASQPVVEKFWELGVNIHQSYDEHRSMLPVVRSCYLGDTSVLTSAFNTRICADQARVVPRIHRDLVGSTKLSGQRLARVINTRISLIQNGKYDGFADVIPKAQISDLDNLRGFSVSIPIDILFGNMRTVWVMAVTALRRSDNTEA